MSVQRGPTRIILIGSGGYAYAEVELDHPIHLVAANNEGKTTLIAALQFLYIDDLHCMHFAHELQKTREHYFRTTESFILFECMTPTGFQVFGLRGLGPVRGYDFERFVFRGVYDRRDFLDGRAVRPWAEVSKSLLKKDLGYLESKHLRQSIVGSADSKGPPLALVPLKRPSTYSSFRFLFRNLLRLSWIDQEHLKNLFIDITRPRMELTEIDPRNDYADLYAKIQRQKAEVDGLRKVKPKFEGLIRSYNTREGLRECLFKTWRTIEHKLDSERLSVAARRTLIAVEQQTIDEKLEAFSKRDLAAGMEINALTEQITRKGQELQRLDQLCKKYQSFEEALEATARANLKIQRDNLISRLTQATKADRQKVKTRLKEIESQLAHDEQLAARFSDALVNWLRQNSDFSDEALDDIFRILDPSLLARLVGPSEVVVSDAPKLLERLRSILSHFTDEGFIMGEVVIHRQALRSGSALSSYQDISIVHERIATARSELLDLQQKLCDIEERDRLQTDCDIAEKDYLGAQRRFEEWQEWKEAEPGKGGIVVKLKELTDKRTETEIGRQNLATEKANLSFQKAQLTEEDQRIQASLTEKVAAVRKLTAPPIDWQPQGTVLYVEGSLPDLIEDYRKSWEKQGKAADTFERFLGEVEKDTDARYTADTEAATISKLRDELEALADHEHDAQELWTSLVGGMKSGFGLLLASLEELRREVARLSRALSGRKISNLRSVELDLVKQEQLVQRLQAVLDEEDLPLFSDFASPQKARQKVVSWLEEGERIEILQLFDIHFTVVDQAGRSQTYKSLDKIHSEGTSTAIKVLVHLELLKNLLNEEAVSIPFFLDEVGKLDEKNLRGLVTHATNMSFVPVLASPDAKDCVRTLYILRPAQGGIVLDETSRMTLPSEVQNAS